MSHTATAPDGTTIAYDRHGEGPLTVIVGGAFQHRAIDESFDRLARTLAAGGRTVVHYDRRGRGESTDTAPYAVEREIEDLGALIAAEGGEARLFGMSSGGILALEAMRAGLPVARAAIYEPPLHVAGAPSDPGLIERLEAACAAGRPGDAVAEFLGPMIGEEGLAGLRAAPVWPAFESVAPTLAYDCRVVEASVGPDGTADLARFADVTVPVLALAGSLGEAFMRDAAVAVAAALPAGEHRELEGQTHEVDVDVLAPVLAAWLEARPPRAAAARRPPPATGPTEP